MTERPIIFSVPMIRALLDGRKTQTRRLAWKEKRLANDIAANKDKMRNGMHIKVHPTLWQHVRPGDRLWAREAWAYVHETAYRHDAELPTAADPNRRGMAAVYRDGWDRSPPTWRSPIHMPRWASRLTLVVTAARIERLQDISEDDAVAEGLVKAANGYFEAPGILHPNPDFGHLCRITAREMYAALWDILHGSGAWLTNPEVIVLSFATRKANIDAVEKEA